MIHLDTNYLIGLLVKGSPEAADVDGWLAAGQSLAASAIAWTEFLNGPVTPRDHAGGSGHRRQDHPFRSAGSRLGRGAFQQDWAPSRFTFRLPDRGDCRPGASGCGDGESS
jgi:hypothetical protein